MERFIIGTGRCGSTLLSNIFSRHPDVLVLSEFLKGFDPWVDGDGENKSGEFFADLLAAPYVVVDLHVRRGFVPSEVLASLGGIDLRTLSIPKPLISTLPLITDKPELLFKEAIEKVRTFPTQPMARHYLMYFEWLREKFKRKLWIERSGASMEILPEVRRMYPDGKYVHLHRDGPETALSMREFAFFRLYVSLYFDPPTREELERTELAGKPIADDDPLTWRMTEGLPSYAQFGDFWSQQVAVGFREFLHMKPDQLLDVKFEDLIARPRETLSVVAEFFGVPENQAWLDEAAAMIAAAPKMRAHLLSPEDRAALERSCRIGQHLLGRSEWPSVDATIKLMKEITDRHAATKQGA
jgi:hypothetical protein